MFKTLIAVTCIMLTYNGSCYDFGTQPEETHTPEPETTYNDRYDVGNQTRSVYGYIIDAATGEYLDEAHVCLKNNLTKECDFLRAHKYSFVYTTSGTYTISAVSEGYISNSIKVVLPSTGQTRKDIRLTPR